MNSTEVETKYISLGYAVERNAILYNDDCFVTLTSDVLDIVAKNQHQCDAATYRSEWQGKIGQLVYLYDACQGRLFKHRVVLRPDMGDDDDVDLRMADKESLTISAGRQLGRYLYTGSGDIAQIAEYCSIAMMLYLRSGQTKDDMYRALEVEYLRAIHQLLDGSDVDIQQLLFGNLYSDDDFSYDPRFDLLPLCPTDIVKVAEEEASRYPDAAFHILDDEIIELLSDIDYPEEDGYFRSIKGQSAIVHTMDYQPYEPEGYLTLDQLRKLTDEDEIFVDTMERLPIYAVELFDGIIFTNNKEYRIAVEDMAEGMALYLKNGKTPLDYLHAFCAALAPSAMHGVTRNINAAD